MRAFCWAVAIGVIFGYAILAVFSPEIAAGCGGHFTTLMLAVLLGIVVTHKEHLR